MMSRFLKGVHMCVNMDISFLTEYWIPKPYLEENVIQELINELTAYIILKKTAGQRWSILFNNVMFSKAKCASKQQH